MEHLHNSFMSEAEKAPQTTIDYVAIRSRASAAENAEMAAACGTDAASFANMNQSQLEAAVKKAKVLLY